MMCKETDLNYSEVLSRHFTGTLNENYVQSHSQYPFLLADRCFRF